MFEHKKPLLHPVKVEKPNPQYAVLMQEQLGGNNGELKAAMQYLSQSFRAKDPVFKDLFLDIGTEELSHMEMVAETINLLNGDDVDYRKVKNGEIETMVTFGLNPALVNSSGNPWTADYVTVTGDLAADLLADIASEQRAKVVYEYLYRQIDDKYVKETIMFLLEREEAHNALFCEALNKIADDVILMIRIQRHRRWQTPVVHQSKRNKSESGKKIFLLFFSVLKASCVIMNKRGDKHAGSRSFLLQYLCHHGRNTCRESGFLWSAGAACRSAQACALGWQSIA